LKGKINFPNGCQSKRKTGLLKEARLGYLQRRRRIFRRFWTNSKIRSWIKSSIFCRFMRQLKRDCSTFEFIWKIQAFLVFRCRFHVRYTLTNGMRHRIITINSLSARRSFQGERNGIFFMSVRSLSRNSRNIMILISS